MRHRGDVPLPQSLADSHRASDRPEPKIVHTASLPSAAYLTVDWNRIYRTIVLFVEADTPTVDPYPPTVHVGGRAFHIETAGRPHPPASLPQAPGSFPTPGPRNRKM